MPSISDIINWIIKLIRAAPAAKKAYETVQDVRKNGFQQTATEMALDALPPFHPERIKLMPEQFRAGASAVLAAFPGDVPEVDQNESAGIVDDGDSVSFEYRPVGKAKAVLVYVLSGGAAEVSVMDCETIDIVRVGAFPDATSAAIAARTEFDNIRNS